jgi:hypothetical protein
MSKTVKSLAVAVFATAGVALAACSSNETTYRPAPSPQPTYTGPTYTQPAPTYTQPAPTYTQPAPTQPRPPAGPAQACGKGKCG